MKSAIHSFALVLAIVWPLALTAPAVAQTGKVYILEGEKGDRGYWKTTYDADPPKQLRQVGPEYPAIRERLMRRRVLEEYAEFLSPVRWPHALGLFASACSGGTGDSPHYLTGQYLMNLCYQFDVMYEKYADDLVKAQSKRKLWTPVSRNSLIAGMYVATLLHETGHAAFDIMDIPVFGREEDAADQFEGFLALQFGKETARTVIKGDAYFWYVEVSDLKADPPIMKPDPRNRNYPNDPGQQCQLDPFCAYAGVHGTASQRMYNMLCIASGGQPDWFKDFVESRWLPPERLKNCPAEYQRVKTAFQNTIMPFIDQEQMKKVQAKSWFTGEEVKER
jgi:hypothetical protein